jgi:aromatic-L-amino-acid decarboxylase
MRNKWTLSGQVTDYRDWQIPLGRRFRAIKVWFVLRAYGLSGLRDHIRKCCQGAKHFADLVVKDDRFEMVRSRVLSLVCFRLKGSNELNQALVDAVTADGQCFIVQSSTHGRTFLRFVVGSPLTTNIHVDKAWAAIQRCAALILAADTASSALSVGHAH